MFRQIVGRFVRTLPGRAAEPSWLYIPADPILRDHAVSVEQELRHALRDRGDPGDLIEFDRPERRETEPGEGLAFEPLSADVAPQMTLFGPAPPATSAAWPPAPVPAPPQAAGADRAEAAAAANVAEGPGDPCVRAPRPSAQGAPPARLRCDAPGANQSARGKRLGEPRGGDHRRRQGHAHAARAFRRAAARQTRRQALISRNAGALPRAPAAGELTTPLRLRVRVGCWASSAEPRTSETEPPRSRSC